MSEPEGPGPDLAPHLRAALLAEGLAPGPSDAQKHRMAARLAAAIGVSAASLLAPPGGGGGAGGGAGGAGAAAGGAAGKTLAIVAGALVAGAAIGFAVSELRPRVSGPAPAPIATPAPAALIDAAPTPDAAPADSDAPLDAAVAVDAASARRDAGARPTVVDAASAVGADELARERQLIDVARSALRAGDLRLATKSLVEHELRFPAGLLAEERRVLAIEVAIAKGDRAGARKLADEFLRAYPRSVFRARVEELVPP